MGRKHAVITGGAGGLGLGCATRLAALGCVRALEAGGPDPPHAHLGGPLLSQAQPFGGGPRPIVERIAFPFVTAIAQFVENAPHEEIHGFRCSPRSFQNGRIMDVPDLDHAVRGVDPQVGGLSGGLVAGAFGRDVAFLVNAGSFVAAAIRSRIGPCENRPT